MGYLPTDERDARLGAVRRIMDRHDLDVALVYYDEFNIGNGWYLTGWCPQFESGAVLVPRAGERAFRKAGQRDNRDPQFPRLYGP